MILLDVYKVNLKYVIKIKIDFETDLNELYKTETEKQIPTIIYTNTIKNKMETMFPPNASAIDPQLLQLDSAMILVE